MDKLIKDIETLQSGLDMIRDTLKGRNGKIDLQYLNYDSGYIKQLAEDIHTTTKEVLAEAELNGYKEWFIA